MSETIHSPEPDLRQDSKAAENELAAKDKDLAFARADAVQRARAFEAAFSSVAEGMVVYDALGQPVMANPAAVADFGFDPSKSDRAGALQKLAVRYPDGKKVPLDKMPSSRALNGEKVVNERYIFTNGKGMDQTILVSAYPLVSRGRISGAVSTSRHVTELENLRQNIQSLSEELKGANEDLRREKNTLRTLIEHVPDDIWFCDAQGNVSLANLSALESLGLGKHIPNGPLSDFASELEIYSPGGDPIALDQLPLFRSLRGKTVKGFEEIIVHPKTGKKLYRAVNSAPVRDSAGNM
ncbi:MAG: PAS domain-containing protein, partial [Deltaproteobacteria bacterium]